MIKLLESIVTIYGDILENEPDLAQVEEAQFNQDFGPWRAGVQVPILALEAEDDAVYLREYSVDNSLVQEVKVCLSVSEN